MLGRVKVSVWLSTHILRGASSSITIEYKCIMYVHPVFLAGMQRCNCSAARVSAPPSSILFIYVYYYLWTCPR